MSAEAADGIRVVTLNKGTARKLAAANPTWAAAVPAWQESQVTTSYEYVDSGGVRRSATETDEMMEKDLTTP